MNEQIKTKGFLYSIQYDTLKFIINENFDFQPKFFYMLPKQ